MNIPDISKSKNLRVLLMGLCIIIIALLIFQAGVFVGYRKALFSEKMAGEYSRVFGPKVGPDMMGSGIPGGHGAAGRVIEINGPVIEVADSNNIEKEILIATSTIVRKMRDAVASSEIKVDDFIVVIGSPNGSGQIEAKLIRLMPPPGFVPVQESR